MRISERYKYSVSNNRIEKAKDQNIQALNQLSSQKRINAIHDDPAGVSRMIKHKDRISEIQSYLSNISFSKGFTAITENAIASVQEHLIRAKELSISMANDSNGPDNRDVTAKEISTLVDQLVELGNTKYNSKYVFSGLRSDAPAFDGDGLYLGDDGDIFIQTDLSQYKKINISGRDLFDGVQSPSGVRQAGNMVQCLINLKTGLESNDKGVINTAMSELEYHIERASSLQATVGAVSSSLFEIEKKLDVMLDHEKGQLSTTEDLDFYQGTSDFKRTEAALQSTLSASNKLLQPSLLNFLDR
ncbi:MAG: flagellar hook-associated protein FlgL [Oligoflexales bacterium]|nr:flagellar hook-associated protein FlgL [Oligoflexales bacterium]